MGEGLKLSALLPARMDALGAQARGKLCKNGEVGAMKLAWDYIGSELNGALAQALDVDLMEVVAKGWAKADTLAGLAGSAGDRSVVELVSHEESHALKPVIAVTIGSCPCVELEFGFALTAHFGGVQLTIADGHIIGGRTGQAWASAQLSCEGVPLHDAADSRKVEIPGDFTFEPPGIRIPASPL